MIFIYLGRRAWQYTAFYTSICIRKQYLHSLAQHEQKRLTDTYDLFDVRPPVFLYYVSNTVFLLICASFCKIYLWVKITTNPNE